MINSYKTGSQKVVNFFSVSVCTGIVNQIYYQSFMVIVNKDLSRKLIAIVSSGKKSLQGYSEQDFITSLSFKKNLLDPDTVKEFISLASNEGLLVKREKLYVPNFSTSGVIVPLDFSVTKEELFSDSKERPLVDRLLEAISASGKMTKKDAIARAREVMKSVRYIPFEIALISIMSDEAIETKGFLEEIKQKWKN